MTDRQVLEIFERAAGRRDAAVDPDLDLDQLAAVIEQVTGRSPTLGDVREILHVGARFYAAPFN